MVAGEHVLVTLEGKIFGYCPYSPPPTKPIHNLVLCWWVMEHSNYTEKQNSRWVGGCGRIITGQLRGNWSEHEWKTGLTTLHLTTVLSLSAQLSKFLPAKAWQPFHEERKEKELQSRTVGKPHRWIGEETFLSEGWPGLPWHPLAKRSNLFLLQKVPNNWGHCSPPSPLHMKIKPVSGTKRKNKPVFKVASRIVLNRCPSHIPRKDRRKSSFVLSFFLSFFFLSFFHSLSLSHTHKCIYVYVHPNAFCFWLLPKATIKASQEYILAKGFGAENKALGMGIQRVFRPGGDPGLTKIL